MNHIYDIAPPVFTSHGDVYVDIKRLVEIQAFELQANKIHRIFVIDGVMGRNIGNDELGVLRVVLDHGVLKIRQGAVRSRGMNDQCEF